MEPVGPDGRRVTLLCIFLAVDPSGGQAVCFTLFYKDGVLHIARVRAFFGTIQKRESDTERHSPKRRYRRMAGGTREFFMAPSSSASMDFYTPLYARGPRKRFIPCGEIGVHLYSAQIFRP